MEVRGRVPGSTQRKRERGCVCQGAVPAESAVGCLPECEGVDKLSAAGRGTCKESWAGRGSGWIRLLRAAEHCRGDTVVFIRNADQL